MALDVKSRSKRYEKLDFLGEGQVRTVRRQNFSNRFSVLFYELDVPSGCLGGVMRRFVSFLVLSTKACYAHALDDNGIKDVLWSRTK